MTTPDARRFVLLVEPEPVLGLDLADAFEDAGYTVAGPIRTPAEALAWATQWQPACAVVDASDQPDAATLSLLSDLGRRNIPTVILADQAGGPADAARASWFLKPIHSADLVSTLQTLLSRELTR